MVPETGISGFEVRIRELYKKISIPMNCILQFVALKYLLRSFLKNDW